MDYPFLLFFKERKDTTTSQLLQQFQHAVEEFCHNNRDLIVSAKSRMPEQLSINTPVRPSVVRIGTATGKKIDPRNPLFYGLASWQPSFAYNPFKVKYNVLKFEQTIWHPSLLATPEGAQHYIEGVRSFAQHLMALGPAVIVQMKEQQEPCFIMAENAEGLLAYLSFNGDLDEFKTPANMEHFKFIAEKAVNIVKILRTGVEKREGGGYVLLSVERPIYKDIVSELESLLKLHPSPELKEEVSDPDLPTGM